MADIEALTQLADSTPEEAAENINRGSILNIEPKAFKEMKAELNPKVDAMMKPTEAEPSVAQYMAQGPEQTALAAPEVEHLNYFERQIRSISDAIFDKPTNERKIIALRNKQIADPESLTEEDKIDLVILNEEKQSLQRRNYGLDGMIETLPAKVAGGVEGMGKNLIGDALKGLDDLPVHHAGGLFNIPMRLAYGIAKGAYDDLVGSTFNELPEDLDFETRKNISRGVGVAGAAINGVVGAATMGTAPWVQQFTRPVLARMIVANPVRAAAVSALGNIAVSGAIGATGAGGTAVAQIFGEELAQSYDGSEVSFDNALHSFNQNIDKHMPRIIEAATVGGLTTGLISTATNVAGFGTLKNRYQGMSEAVNDFRAGNARDVTPKAPEQLNPAFNPDQPIDVTPTAPMQGPSPTRQSMMILQTREAMQNISNVAKSMKLTELAPGQMTAIKKLLFENAGMKKFYIASETVKNWETDPKKLEYIKNLFGKHGTTAKDMGAPIDVDPAAVMEVARQFPEILDHIQTSPEGPSPLMAEEYLKKMQAAEAKRKDVLENLNAIPFDQVDVPQKETFKGVLNVVHGSPVELDKFVAPDQVDKNNRYDSGNGEFGRNTYFDESGYWVAADGEMEQGGRGIGFKHVYGVNLEFKNALVVSPKTLPKLKGILGKIDLKAMRQEDVPNDLKALGYDGIIIRGIEEEVKKLQAEFDERNPSIFKLLGLDPSEKASYEGLSKSELDRERSLYDQRQKYVNLKLGLRDAGAWQNQVVSFAPQESAVIRTKLGERGQVTKQQVDDFKKSNNIRDTAMKQALGDIPELSDVFNEPDHLNAPVYTEVLKAILPPAEVARFEKAIANGRMADIEAAKDKAFYEMEKVRDVQIDAAMELRAEEERARIENDPNLAIVESFLNKAIPHKKGSKGVSLYAMDPKTLSDKQIKYATDPKLNFRLKQYGAFKGTLTPDEAAKKLGVENGDTLLKILSSTPTREEIVQARTLAHQATIEQQIRDNLDLNESRVIKLLDDKAKRPLELIKYMRMKEWPALKGAIKRVALPPPKIEELQHKARTAITQTKVGDLNVQQYKVGERKSQRIAVTSILKSEVPQAHQAFENQALNIQMQKETMLAIAKANRVIKYAKRFNTKEGMAVLKQAGNDFVEAANEILDVFNLSPAKKGISIEGSYARWVKKQYENGSGDFGINPDLVDIRQNVNEMTVEQLLAVGDRLKSIYHLAQWSNQMFNQFRKEDMLQTKEAFVEESVSKLLLHPGRNVNKIPSVQDTVKLRESLRRRIQSGTSMFLNMEQVVRELDEGKLGGFFQEELMHGIKGDGTLDQKSGFTKVKKMTKDLHDHFKAHIEVYNELSDIKFDDIESKILVIPEFDKSPALQNGNLTRGDLMRLWAYGGDPYAKEQRAQNMGVSDEVIQKVLDKYLEPHDVDFMQKAIVDHFKTYQAETAALQMRTKGLTVDFVKGVPNTHRGQTYAGGYVPVEYKVDFTDKAIERLNKSLDDQKAAFYEGNDNAEIFAKQYADRQTEQGRLEQRTGSKAPLDLSLMRMARNFEEIIHDLSYREAIRDNLAKLGDKEFKAAAIAVVGKEKYGIMVNTTIELANQIESVNANYFSDQTRYLQSLFDKLQSNFSVTVLGFNFTSTAIQTQAITQMMQNMGPKGVTHWQEVNARIAQNPKHFGAFFTFARELDPTIGQFMDQVKDSVDSMVYDIMPGKYLHKSIRTLADAHDKFINVAMGPMALVDIMLKMSNALSGYEQFMAGDVENWPLEKVQALDDRERHEQAQAYVRQLSRLSLTHGRMEDKAPFQKYVGSKFFANYFNDLRNVLNNQINQGRKTKWHAQDMWSDWVEGEDEHAWSNAKLTAASVLGIALIAVASNTINDVIRENANPYMDIRHGRFKTKQDLLNSADFHMRYILSSPHRHFFGSAPFLRDINYAVNSKKRGDVRDVTLPITKIFSDASTVVYSLDDLWNDTPLSRQQGYAWANTFSYWVLPLPVNGYKKAQVFAEERAFEAAKAKKKIAQGLDTVKGRIDAFMEKHGNDLPEPMKKEIEEARAELEPYTPVAVPEEAADLMMMATSQGKWSKFDPETGAAGIYQFTPERWKAIQAAAPELGLTDNGRVSKDSAQQEDAIKWSNQRNAEQLSNRNIPVTNESLLGAHMLGVENFIKLSEAKATEKIKAVFGDKVPAELSKFKTIGQVRSYINSRLVEGEARYNELTSKVTTTED